MPNRIFRNRLINSVRTAIKEAETASAIEHDGLAGRIRELAAEYILQPLLPFSYGIGTGKVTDKHGALSPEIDLLIFHRGLLPAVAYSERFGVYPTESTYYVVEVKTRLNATELQDAIRKARAVGQLDGPGHGTILFAFGSDLAADSSEFERYKRYDPLWQTAPAFTVICVVGRGSWVLLREHGWKWQPATDDHDEVLVIMATFVNTLIGQAGQRRPVFGDYVRPDDQPNAGDGPPQG